MWGFLTHYHPRRAENRYKYCQHCKKQIDEDAKFCKYCGKPVEEERIENIVKTFYFKSNAKNRSSIQEINDWFEENQNIQIDRISFESVSRFQPGFLEIVHEASLQKVSIMYHVTPNIKNRYMVSDYTVGAVKKIFLYSFFYDAYGFKSDGNCVELLDNAIHEKIKENMDERTLVYADKHIFSARLYEIPFTVGTGFMLWLTHKDNSVESDE